MNLKILFFISFYISSNLAFSQSITNTPNLNYALTNQPNYFSLYDLQNPHFKYPKTLDNNYLLHHNFYTNIYINTIDQSTNNRILYQNAKSLSSIQNKPFNPMSREGSWDNPSNSVSLENAVLNSEVVFAIWELFNP
ncbi:hypothetical protein ATE84_1345 [Aquimarina sp. MAR_2010_214]|uniref:hypothetical protein n=1 Tax=Aquimarina sp. MAR_2010_214 TaxID=1250026 RepID=UPI000C7063DD|nr:hypothetical protein [Aquimarina sp. MAR_2010_214]PKV49324.1 hypothetical protein ATE84_1345 [Aquimarina sp. MAR_2010_214]